MMSSRIARSAKPANPQRAGELRVRRHTHADSHRIFSRRIFSRRIFSCWIFSRDPDAARCDDDPRMAR